MKRWLKSTLKPQQVRYLLSFRNFEALETQQWQDPDTLHNVVASTAEQCEVGMGKVGMPLRIAITGSGQSPDIGITLKLWERKSTI